MNRTATLTLFALVVAPAMSACKGCRDDHPYVPYSISDGGGTAMVNGDARVPAIEQEGGTSFAQESALPAPPLATEWALGGLTIEAPPGTVFALGLARDFDDDGALDALAVVRNKEPGDPGRIVFYKGKGGGSVEPGLVVGAPLVAPAGSAHAPSPTCSPLQRLTQIGRHSLYVELGEVCAAPVTPPPTRWAAVVLVGHSASVHLALLIADPPGAPTLTLDADGTDRDGDGLDDVSLRVTLEGGGPPFEPGPRVSAWVRWLDRPAGMSREPDQPEASFHALASQAATHAGRAKEAPSVPPFTQQVRALYAAICGEGGAARIVSILVGNHPIVCGGTSRGLEEAGLAETRALVTTGDVTGAIAAFDRAQVPPATHTPSRTTEAQGLIAQAAPVVLASSLRAIGAVPWIDHGTAPAWSALAFEPTGKLLVRTLAGTVRVDPLMGDEAAAADVAAWKAPVVSPDGSLRWSALREPCDASALRATFSSTASADEREVLLPIHGRLGAHCTGPKGELAPAVPLVWGTSGLEAIVMGQPVVFAPDITRASLLGSTAGPPSVLGGPRSPDGKTMVIPTSQGILVRSVRPHLYRAKELDGAYPELRDCAVSDDTSRVACVRGGRAFVGVWSAP